jgi:hypothetical protein
MPSTHDIAAGRTMGWMAHELVVLRRPGDSALEILDLICAPYRDTHAQFEAWHSDLPGRMGDAFERYTDPHPAAWLGMLMVEAFAPHGLADLPRYRAMTEARRGARLAPGGAAAETAYLAWWSEVYVPFRMRYGFW